MKDIDLLKVNIKSNMPLLITNENDMWKVEKGSVNIFVSKIKNDEPFGARSFLAEANCDDIFFSLGSLQLDYKYGLVVVPKEDSILTNIKFNNATFTFSDECLEKSKHWITKTAYNCGIQKKEIDAICNNLDNYKIIDYNKNLLNIFVKQIKDNKEKEKHKLKQRIENDNFNFKKGIINLGGVILPKKRKRAIENFTTQDYRNELYKVCRAVAKSKNIKIAYPDYIDENTISSEKMLESIADVSHFRIRQISLKDGWYKKNGGSMVAYKKSDHSPVALVQYKPNKYKMFDPKRNISIVVTSHIAEKIEPHAYMFYRNLPLKPLSTKEIFQFILKGVHKYDIALVFIMGILGGLLGIITPEITGKVFDTVIPDGNSSTLIHIGFLMLSVSIATFAFDLTRYFATMRIEFISEQDLQSAVWDRALSLPVKFFRNVSTGEMMQNIMGITSIKNVISGSVINTITSSIFSLFFLIMLFRYSVKLAFISLALLIAVFLISMAINISQLKYQKKLVEGNNRMSGKVFDWLNGLMKIKISGSEKRVFSLWAEDFSNIRSNSIKKDKLRNYSVTFNSVINILISMVLYFSLSKISDSGLTAGKFIAFTTALGKLISSSIEFSRTLLQVNVVGPLYKKIKPIFEATPEYDEHKQNPGKLKGELEVSHLSFSYSVDSPMVLDDISFHVKSGEYVAIVGASGCGKSTLLRNLLGFEIPNSGQLYFDGKSLEQIDVRAVRKQIGVVLQTGAILTGSIYENVAAANPTLSYDDVWKALEIANIDKEIRNMPMGLNTVIMEGSPALSGGQVQRILIARAIANNPCILFLDEATSALDNQTQDVVSKNLDKMGITRLVIAHRLSTIINCDKIIVLDKGKIAEEGTFENLIKLNGIFASMAKRQMI